MDVAIGGKGTSPHVLIDFLYEWIFGSGNGRGLRFDQTAFRVERESSLQEACVPSFAAVLPEY